MTAAAVIVVLGGSSGSGSGQVRRNVNLVVKNEN